MVPYVPYVFLVMSVFISTYGQRDLFHRVCYFPSWKYELVGVSRFGVSNITDSTLCTHIIVAFAGVDPDLFTIKPLQFNDDGEKGLWRNITNIKLLNPYLKILLAVGGWDFGSLPFSKLVQTNAGVDKFATNAVAFLRSRNFDGLDIDWEYPAQSGSPPLDKRRYTYLLKRISRRFWEESLRTGRQRLRLTIAVPVEKSFVDEGFEVNRIGRYVDFVNLMSYDMYGPWGEVIGHHAALYGKPDDTPYMEHRNVHWVVNYWIAKGMPFNKIVVGIPLYGRSFTPINQTVNREGFPFKSVGIGGPFTGSTGLIGAFELCQVLDDPLYQVKWDYFAQVPFAFSDSAWIGYDDDQSIAIKTNYVKARRLGGVMVWDMSLDDATGAFCNEGRYPLLSKIKQILTETPRPTIVRNPVLTYRDYYKLWLSQLLG